jgi:hypothetical protein
LPALPARLHLPRAPSDWTERPTQVIAEKGQLIIGPGVRLNFFPRTGITVHGILTTQVSQNSLNIIIFGVKNNFSFSTIFAFLIYIG